MQEIAARKLHGLLRVELFTNVRLTDPASSAPRIRTQAKHLD